ncbi:MAG: hypothetical protein JNL70_11770 [Saprospiraceae bacterium]|nr:hypothetical protein [Saprospiraceae bacterium]
MMLKKISNSKQPSPLTLLLLLVVSTAFVCKDQIEAFYYTRFEEHRVSEVVSNLHNFEALPAFAITGVTLQGGSFYAIKGFPLQDTESDQKVYIVPKGNTLPPPNQVQTFKVKVQRQFKVPLVDWEIIVLEEV